MGSDDLETYLLASRFGFFSVDFWHYLATTEETTVLKRWVWLIIDRVIISLTNPFIKENILGFPLSYWICSVAPAIATWLSFFVCSHTVYLLDKREGLISSPFFNLLLYCIFWHFSNPPIQWNGCRVLHFIAFFCSSLVKLFFKKNSTHNID